MSQLAFYSHGFQNTAERFDNVTLPTFQCSEWTQDQVLNWLKGIDDCILPYIRTFRRGNVDGRVLLLLDDADLLRRGINSPFVREKVLHAIKLLQYYTYNVHEENLQKLAMLVTVDVNNLNQCISKASPVIEQFNNGSDQLAGQRLTAVLNSVLMGFSVVYEHVKKLVFWLDRAPFENIKEYVHLRDRITELILEMLDSVNPQNRRFMPVSEVLHDRGLKLREICQQIVFNTDPSILYVPYFATAYIRNSDYSCGINFQSVFNGINLVTSIDPESPAGRCKKLNAGDEIVEINGATVVGWNFDKVRDRLRHSSTDKQQLNDLRLMISRRPRDEGGSAGLSKSKTSETLLADDDYESRTRLELDFSLKIDPDMFANREGTKRKLHRRRSSSFSFIGDGAKKNPNRLSMPVFNSSTIIASRTVGNDRKLYRRASVWSDSPPASFAAASRKIQNGLESKALMHLLDCWTEPKARTNGHLRLVRASRVAKTTNGFTDVNNTVPEEDEENSIIEEKADKVDYTKVDIVLPTEAEKLKLSMPSVNDPEWNAPVQEITGLRLMRRLHLESTSSMAPDSPLSAAFTKISRFWSGDTASNSAMSTSYTSDKTDGSIPSTPVSKNALEKIVKEKTRQTTPLSNGLPVARPTNVSPEPISSNISSPRYCTVRMRQNLAPLAEPEDDEERRSREINLNSIASESSVADTIDLETFVRTPCRQLVNKSMEGWVRRQRIISDPTYSRQKKPSQWIKAWVVLVDNRVMLSYSNQFAKSADVALDLHKCYFKSSPVDIKTSKKFIFCLSSGRTWYHFAPYSQQEYTNWSERIIPLIRVTESSSNNNSPPETMMTNNSLHKNDVDIPSSPAAHTLPRAFYARGKYLNIDRQGSLNRAFGPPGTPSSDVLSHSSAANSVEDMNALKTVR